MSLGLEEAVAYLEASKQLVAPTGWRPKGNRDRQYPITFCECRVRMGGSMPRGLTFRISVFPSFPDMATFQLECSQPASRTCIVLYRLEWRPISGHGNREDDHVPSEIRGLIFLPGDTHEHVCTDNVSASEKRLIMPGVHAARPISPDFQTYQDAFSHVCAKLKIENPGEVPPPGDQLWLGV